MFHPKELWMSFIVTFGLLFTWLTKVQPAVLLLGIEAILCRRSMDNSPDLTAFCLR